MKMSNLFSKPEPVSAIKLLQRISKRAEDLTPEEQAKSFVSVRNNEGTLTNRDNRIMFGRRGTGKTHIFSYVAQNIRSRGDIAVTLDLRVIGSNNSIYADETKPSHMRATHLIRDLLDAIYQKLLEEYTKPGSELATKDLHKQIIGISECIKTVRVVETFEAKQTDNETAEAKASVATDVKVSPVNSELTFKANASAAVSARSAKEGIDRGSVQLTVNMGDAFNAINAYAVGSGCRTWILLDEWSAIPESLQPYLADFLRRAVFPVQNVSVQIAAIEFRSRFRIDHGHTKIGLELGSDIFADINLDDYFVYDNSPVIATDFFRKMLFRHLLAFSGSGELAEKNEKEVTDSVFSQERVFQELVRASEGVPRDFINILQLAAMRSDASKLSMTEIRIAAKDWYERDKQRNIDDNPRAQALLEFIRDRVIFKKKARAFLISTSVADESIEFLFDERMLHIARRSYSAQDDPGTRYRVWKVDYGCYVDLMNTVKSPTGFITEGIEVDAAGDFAVPEDDFRAVRRAILDMGEFNKEASI